MILMGFLNDCDRFIYAFEREFLHDAMVGIDTTTNVGINMTTSMGIYMTTTLWTIFSDVPFFPDIISFRVPG